MTFIARVKLVVVAGIVFIGIAACNASHDAGRTAEKAAEPSQSHPYAGFWKQSGCADNFGLAIAPALGQNYSVSFCGPGGCFKPGTYRPDTPLVGDPDYRIVDKDTIEIRGLDGFSLRRLHHPRLSR